MPGVCRLGDMSVGHGCWPSRENDQASANVFINGLGGHRQGDHWVTHCCGPACHDGYLARGSATVFVNGLTLGRIGDPIEGGCNEADFVKGGSADVFAGP